MWKWVAIAWLVVSSAIAAQELPARDEVLALPADVRARFQTEVVDAGHTPKVRLRRLVNFMFEEEGLGLEYDNQRSRTVAEVIADRKANCLSFTLTFMELARIAGFRTKMMESEQALVWFLQEKTLFLAAHVSAQVRLGQRSFEVNFDPNQPLLRGAQQTVSDDRAMAHFYNNRAAEMMAEEQFETAQASFKEALRLDPTMVPALNNQGVLYMRLGDWAKAEASYTRALRLNPDNLSVLTNLINLRRAQGQLGEAEKLEVVLEQTQRKNPLHHFLVGVHAEQEGDFPEALDHFQTARRLDRKEPLFELALERVYSSLGNESKADVHGRRAKRLVERYASRANEPVRDYNRRSIQR